MEEAMRNLFGLVRSVAVLSRQVTSSFNLWHNCATNLSPFSFIPSLTSCCLKCWDGLKQCIAFAIHVVLERSWLDWKGEMFSYLVMMEVEMVWEMSCIDGWDGWDVDSCG
eukprot:2141027-Ditylum_brightwellii.AAC.2